MDLNFPIEKAILTTKAHLKKLEKMGITTVGDFLEYYPRIIESTEIIRQFPDIQLGMKNTVSGQLCDVRKEKTARGKTLVKGALVLDDNSTIDCIWFQVPYVLKNLKDESHVFLVGKIDRNYGKIQISNPEIHLGENVHVGKLRAIYPESPPLTSKWFREKMAGLLMFTNKFPEILPDKIKKEEQFMDKPEAMKQLHSPSDFKSWQEAKRRLAFEELFEIQCRVFQRKKVNEQNTTNQYHVQFDPEIVKEDLKKLPFELTVAQKKCLMEILKDFEGDGPAHRLMQGDVGSGKTIVAFLACLQMIRTGAQVAILAPTEILAKQHFAGALKFFPAEYRVELLTGSVTTKNKEKIKHHLQNGDIHVLIGTHALFTEDTVFRNLGFAVIDEQHRFGVAQRDILGQTGAHVLAMTATPIPRTLALTMYGDQDISQITELPPGRKPIITRVVGDSKTTTLCYRFIEDQIIKGRQIFWICPLVDESDKIEAKNVKDEYERIAQELYPKYRVEFLHGKMKPKEKDAIMNRFKNHEFDILVSTSVIEVGVDIPNSTVMVIENSERFGLSQLHQFRGRIGRNDMQSYCFLMVGKTEDKNKERLRAMERTNNGLKLSEIDLKLRGMGELYGTRQSGIPDFKCADLTDIETLQKSRDWAIEILDEDLTLAKYPALKHKVENGEVYF
jgi:ATP-dependent DNA helicase RecG